MRFDPARTTPIGLSRYARDFFDTAMAADDVVGMRPGFERHAPVPVMYLIAHAIELSLKSYLSHRGETLEDLASRKFGHNLVACYERAVELGLGNIVVFDLGDLEAFRVLNELYSTKQLNYIVSGFKTVPVFGPIQKFAESLLNAVGPTVGYR